MHFRALLSAGGVVVIAAGTLFACAVGGPGPGGETVSELIGDAGVAGVVGAGGDAAKMTVDSSSGVVDTGSSVMVPEESGPPEADTVEDSGDQTEAAAPPSSEGGSCNLSTCAACQPLGTIMTMACCTTTGTCGCGAAGVCIAL
jgi:hypothetical protein